jgi:hypothetical protein
MGDKWNAYRLLVGKQEVKRPLGKPKCRQVDNLKLDHGEMGIEGGVDYIGLAEDRDQWRALRDAVMNLCVPFSSGKCLNNGIAGSFSRRAELRGVS